MKHHMWRCCHQLAYKPPTCPILHTKFSHLSFSARLLIRNSLPFRLRVSRFFCLRVSYGMFTHNWPFYYWNEIFFHNTYDHDYYRSPRSPNICKLFSVELKKWKLCYRKRVTQIKNDARSRTFARNWSFWRRFCFWFDSLCVYFANLVKMIFLNVTVVRYVSNLGCPLKIPSCTNKIFAFLYGSSCTSDVVSSEFFRKTTLLWDMTCSIKFRFQFAVNLVYKQRN